MLLSEKCISPVAVGNAVHNGLVLNLKTGTNEFCSALVQMSSRLKPIAINSLEERHFQEVF